MSYPDYPNNRLIVDGVDMSERFGLILTDGYTIDPPEPKTYTVDIPGGNGVIDLTETLLGDVTYKNRKMEFEFYVVGLYDAEEFETLTNSIKQFIHGKAYDFKITMDPLYTYHGRFTLSDIKHSMYANGLAGYMKLSVDAEPYKFLPDQIYRINAVGGKTIYLESGRKIVRPVIESTGFVKVAFNNKLYTLPAGAWTINDILFKQGMNEIYFNTYDIKNLTWGDLKKNEVTWDEFRKKRIYEWYKTNGEGTLVNKTWNDVKEQTWADYSDTKWSELMYLSEITSNIDDVYIKYKVGEL